MATTKKKIEYIKALSIFSDPIRMIITLKKGIILAFTKSEPIKFLNEELFEEEYSIKECSKDETYIYALELYDNRICISTSKRILIISLKEKEYKIDETIKTNSEAKSIIELNDKRLVIGLENQICLYKRKKGYEQEKELKNIFEKTLSQLIKISDFEICALSLGNEGENKIKFIDTINTDKIKGEISNIRGNDNICNNAKMINEDILAIIGYCSEGMYLIDVKKYSLIKKIDMNFGSAILPLKNGNIFTIEGDDVSGCDVLKIWKIDEKGENWECVFQEEFDTSLGFPCYCAEIKDDGTVICGNEGGNLYFFKVNNETMFDEAGN